MSRFQFICMERGCGPCGVKLAEFETSRTETLDGELVARETIPVLVSTCCGGDVEIWDDEKDDSAGFTIALEKQP